MAAPLKSAGELTLIDKVLIVDDQFLVRQMLEESVSRKGYDVRSAASGEEAVELLKHEEFQLAFVDLKLGKLSGIDVLKFSRDKFPDMLFVIMTAYGTVQEAVSAMKLGAFDFVMKPFTPDQMDIIIDKAENWLSLRERSLYLKNELYSDADYSSKAIGSSQPISDIRKLIARVAPTEATVLIAGESGTGKEVIASEIERLYNPLREKPYIKLNCAAIPEKLLESELFGHEKGAFTGANERRIGRFELADRGTLLLDEISEISLEMQAKLLRVLQESEFERIGGNKTIKTNVRIIATTNRDLRRQVALGKFREDLYYRLNVFPINIPSLRDRGDDVIEMAEYFLKTENRKLGKKLYFAPPAVSLMKQYSWPGNVRELKHMVERLAILHDGPAINRENLPQDILNSGREYIIDKNMIGDIFFNLKEIEKYMISCALKKTKGNQTKAAKLLGFSRRTLINKMKLLQETPTYVPETASVDASAV